MQCGAVVGFDLVTSHAEETSDEGLEDVLQALRVIIPRARGQPATRSSSASSSSVGPCVMLYNDSIAMCSFLEKHPELAEPFSAVE